MSGIQIVTVSCLIMQKTNLHQDHFGPICQSFWILFENIFFWRLVQRKFEVIVTDGVLKEGLRVTAVAVPATVGRGHAVPVKHVKIY